MASQVLIRRTVPNDHSCLFWAIGYVGEGGVISRARASELRDICARDVAADADPVTRALLLGVDSVEAYAAWIKNEHNWGGENEIVTLSRFYLVEIAIVCCDSLRVMYYGTDDPNTTHRVFLLYTGQHYDPLVTGASKDTPVAEEQRKFPKGDASLEAQALDEARAHNVAAARKAAQRTVKRIKCGGCGALCEGNDGFAKHCGEVEHDDDFAYDCQEVEITIEEGEALPEGSMDLAADSVHSFYNTEREPLASSYPCSIAVEGITFKTLEHFWQSAPLSGNAEAVASIAAAGTAADAIIAGRGVGPELQAEGWDARRESVRLAAERAKFQQHPELAAQLLATGDKTIVLVDPDPWAGMQAPGGIATGQNHVGKALMAVRAELRATA